MSRSVFTDRYNRLCELLVEARRSRRLTQAEVARRLGRPQSFVSKFEMGERRLDVVEFLDVARAIGVCGIDLIRRLEPEKHHSRRAK